MTRNTNKAMVAGVAAGMADDMGWPVLAIRVFYVVSFFFFGLGFVLYLLAWMFTPHGGGGQMNLRMG